MIGSTKVDPTPRHADVEARRAAAAHGLRVRPSAPAHGADADHLDEGSQARPHHYRRVLSRLAALFDQGPLGAVPRSLPAALSRAPPRLAAPLPGAARGCDRRARL